MDTANVMQEQWDYLIILDACRYDYFEQTYRKYIQGELTKKITVGTSTNEWRDNSFPDYYDDVVYISANPQISATLPVYGFLAGEHFCKVYEVWRDGWDKDVGTVLPQTLTNTAINIIRNTRDKRFIIHYLQPHAPYLSLAATSKGYATGQINADRALIGADGRKDVSTIKKKLLKNLLKLFRNNTVLTNQPAWVLRKLLGILPQAAMESAWRKAGKKRLRDAYKANLESVLQQVAVLLKHLSGKIIITSDHGELLGDNNCYAHPTGSFNPVLLEVPWLAIEKRKENAEPLDSFVESRGAEATSKPQADTKQRHEKELAEKLRALGYYD